LPIIVFDMNRQGNLLRVVAGEKVGTLVNVSFKSGAEPGGCSRGGFDRVRVSKIPETGMSGLSFWNFSARFRAGPGFVKSNPPRRAVPDSGAGSAPASNRQ